MRWDRALRALVCRPPGATEDFLLAPAIVRRNDTSAASINEWTGG